MTNPGLADLQKENTLIGDQLGAEETPSTTMIRSSAMLADGFLALGPPNSGQLRTESTPAEGSDDICGFQECVRIGDELPGL